MPVVGTRAGGIPEAVADDVTGVIVPPHDDAALADAILALLRDRARRDAYGRAARERVMNAFGVTRLVSDTARVYAKRLSARG